MEDYFSWVARSGFMTVIFITVFTPLFSFPERAFAATTHCPAKMECGSYTIAGFGTRKQQIFGSGATTLDLAVAMLETNTMQATYPYSDGKTGDAANFGIFKQNWYMLRTACRRFSGGVSNSYPGGAVLNNSLSTDVTCLHQSQNYYGINLWFAGERDGQTGLSSPNLPTIIMYKTAVYWIQSQLMSQSTNRSNNTRFWVQVPAI